jgi:RsiW-degrading membrane proteinase PrsW (M82 family)
MARYSVLRLMMFFGFLLVLWLLGLRGLWLVLVAALGSMAVSYFVLAGPREEFSRRLAARVDERAARAAQAPSDEDAEDEEAGGSTPA